GARTPRRGGGDRRRLRAQAYRRPRQERRFEPVHSLTSSPSEHRRSMNTMKAVRLFEFGGPDKLRYGDHPMPDVGSTDVLVKVLPTSVSRWDVKYRTGEGHEFYGKSTGHHGGIHGRRAFPMPMQLGRDVAGEVAAVGASVTTLRATACSACPIPKTRSRAQAFAGSEISPAESSYPATPCSAVTRSSCPAPRATGSK